MKKFFSVILSWIIIFVIFFVVGEVCFRIFRGNPNPLKEITQQQSGMLFTPNHTRQSKSSKKGEFNKTVTTNQYGYRGAHFEMPKPKNRLRIFAIGDSFTAGVGAGDEETIPHLMEQTLKQQGHNVEVINAGIGHTGPARHFINLRDIHMQYEPDMVVLLLDLTDLRDDWYTERHGVFNEEGEILRMDPFYVNGKRDWWITAVRYSAFCRYFHDKVVRSFIKMKDLGLGRYIEAKNKGLRAKAVIISSNDIDEDIKFKYDALFFMRGKQYKHIIDKHWQRTAKYILAIRDKLAAQNIPMVLVMYPHGIYVGEEEWSEGRKTWGFEQNKVYTDHYPFQLVEAFSQRQGIPFINTLSAFLTPYEGKYFYDWDGHMTPKGYALTSETILNHPAFQETLTKSLQNISQ